MSQGGSGNGALYVLALPVEGTMNTERKQVEGARMVRMAAEMLDCHACHLPLKHPIFKCDADHLVCSSCRGVHSETCGRPVVHSTLAEAFAAAAFVPCVYECCGPGYVLYHEAADHRLTCQHAPCGCPERCGFSGSREELLKHISGDHSRTIIVVRYGKPGSLSLPLSQRWQVLVDEEDKSDQHRNVFLVSLDERGTEVAVSLVCIGAPGSPQLLYKLAVAHADDGTTQTLESPVMRSSSLSNKAPGEVKCLTVKKEYLSGDIVPLSIRIDRLAHPPLPLSPTPLPFSPKSPPFSPTRPFSPKSPPFSPTGPFSPKPSPKRACSPKPHYVAPAPCVASLEGKCYKRTRRGTSYQQ